MMVVLIVLSFPALCAVGCYIWWRRDDGYATEAAIFLSIMLGTLSLFWVIGWIDVALSTYSTARSLDAFSHDTFPSYQQQACSNGRLVVDNALLGDIRRYNQNLNKMRAWNDVPIIEWAVADVDDDLKPVTLAECPK